MPAQIYLPMRIKLHTLQQLTVRAAVRVLPDGHPAQRQHTAKHQIGSCHMASSAPQSKPNKLQDRICHKWPRQEAEPPETLQPSTPLKAGPGS